MKRTDRVTSAARGSGSFLDPPTYPTHSYGIELDTNRRPENRGSAGLTAALDEGNGYLSPETRAEARRILDVWQPPALDSEEISDWVAQVLGYFRNCYRGVDAGPYGRGEWAAESLQIEPETDPVLNADLHAGVHHIRKFYPDFVPTAADFERAYWGTKPE